MRRGASPEVARSLSDTMRHASELGGSACSRVRLIGRSKPRNCPGVHAKLICTDHQQSVHAQHVAERIESTPPVTPSPRGLTSRTKRDETSVRFAHCSPRLTRTGRFAHDPTARVLFARRQRVSQPSRNSAGASQASGSPGRLGRSSHSSGPRDRSGHRCVTRGSRRHRPARQPGLYRREPLLRVRK